MKVISASCFHSYCFLSTLLVMMGLLKVATCYTYPTCSLRLLNTSVTEPGENVEADDRVCLFGSLLTSNLGCMFQLSFLCKCKHFLAPLLYLLSNVLLLDVQLQKQCGKYCLSVGLKQRQVVVNICLKMNVKCGLNKNDGSFEPSQDTGMSF